MWIWWMMAGALASETKESVGRAAAEESVEVEAEKKVRPPFRFSISTSLFVVATALPDEESPAFFQLNGGLRVTQKDVISLEAITWQYHAPLGIWYGPDKGKPEHRYPGKVRSVGLGVAYQRFIIKGLYAALHTVPFYQTYIDAEGKRIQSGLQVFMTARVGYHLSFFKKRIFLEPSIAATAWPIQTNRPESFIETERGWPSYFLLEPGLHAGVRF